MSTVGVWISQSEIAALPASGTAWAALLSRANQPIGTPTLADQNSSANVNTMAKALVYAKTGTVSYRTDVEAALNVIANTNTEDDSGSRGLSVGRELGAYVIAADLIDLQANNPTLDAQFRAKLNLLLTKVLPDGKTLTSTHEDRPNNWGTHAGASRAAVAVYLGNTVVLNRCAAVFHGWLGDRTAYSSFKYDSDLTWHSDPSQPRGVNPLGSTKSGHNIDGALPDDMRRGASFTWPPVYTGYAWEAMQGAVAQAEILFRAGFPTWTWENNAMRRAAEFLVRLATVDPADSRWNPASDDSWQPWIINKRYNATIVSATSPTTPGKNVGFSDWTHAASGATNTAPTVNAGADTTAVAGTSITLTGTATDDGLPSGALTYAWSKLSGPGTVTFGTPSALSTTANFAAAGTYQIRLSVGDGSLTSSDTLNVTVSAANTAPVVDAGVNKSVTMPSAVTVTGSATDDGLPSGALTYAWSKLSGPGTVTFGTPNALSTTATFSVAGTYILTLTASDGALSGSDTVTVTVNAAGNDNPVVNAGVDRTAVTGTAITLTGSATDASGTTLNYSWNVVSGPGAVTFGSPTSATTTATFAAAGSYTLRLTVTDGLGGTGSDDVTVSVAVSGATNLAPVVNAGVDDDRVLSSGVADFSPQPTFSDDGLPVGGTVTRVWSLVSGPGSPIFDDATDPYAQIHFTVAGTYILRFTYSDGALSTSDTVTVIVRSSVSPMVVDAGPAITVSSGGTAVMDPTVTDPNTPILAHPLSYTWTVVSVPAGGVATFSDASVAKPTVTFSKIGTYVLQLSAGTIIPGYGSTKSQDTVTVDVLTLATNTAPVVNAGVDKSGLVGDFITFSGSATDDGVPAGSVLSYAWSKVSGPGTVSFSGVSQTDPVATATFSAAGTYVLRLTVTDSFLAGTDDVTVTITGGTNVAPTVNAGADQTLSYPSTVTLNGSASDDGLPSGSTLTYTWTKVSGPGTVAFGDDTSASTTATFSAAGTYVLRLTASDGSLSGSDDVTIVLNAASVFSVNAGADQTVQLPATAVLSGSATLNGAPVGSGYTYAWTQIGGPAAAVFNNTVSASTVVSFPISGVYTLQLSATNGTFSDNDEVQITALAANTAPVVNGGPDQTISISSPTASLAGSATDDGLPAGSTLTYTWSKASGPGTVTFGNANSASTTATFSAAGTYVLVLTVSDGALSDVDEVIVTVNDVATNTPPVVNAGTDQTVTLPSTATLVGTVTDDGLPTGLSLSYVWNKVSGPAGALVAYSNQSGLTNTVTFQTAGTYVFRLTASDGSLSGQDDVTVVVNPFTGVNQPPVVNVGSDLFNSIPSALPISGTATDDGLPVGSTLSYTWSKVSGPGTVTFANANSASTTATFSAAGSYRLRLTVSDGQLSGFDELNVSVTLPTNQAPGVTAGPDKIINLPTNTATLQGSATDDGLPVGSTLAYTWTKVSGPGTVTFSNANSPTPVATFSSLGTYTLRLTVSDGALSDSDDVVITVNPANTAPVVNAGSDQVLSATAQGRATMAATATDDGSPFGTLTYQWSVVSGPGEATFSDATALNPIVSFQLPGIYVLRLVVSDGSLSAFDELSVYTAAGANNSAPVVNAGADQTIFKSNTLFLTGSATDDGLPSGSTLTYQWTKVSGPGSVVWSSEIVQNPTATFSTAGTYVLRLTASDGFLTGSDDVTVTVNPDPVNQAPVANAGPDQTVSLPDSVTLVGSATDDGLPAPSALTYRWTKVSGPGAVTFGDAFAPVTFVSLNMGGTYVLRLTVLDGLLSSTDDITITAINDPPVVDAGAGQTVTLAGASVNVTLTATVTDDTYVTPLTYSWVNSFGPAPVTIASPSAISTQVTFTQTGLYGFSFSCYDGEHAGNDTANVQVNAVNTGPTVDAGPDQTITLPAGANLVGTVSDDGNPIHLLNHEWTQTSGPGIATFSEAISTIPTVTFSAPGVYVLRLTATDSVLTAFDEVTITVNPGTGTNQPPIVNAGVDQTITLPAMASLSGSATDDGLPTGSTLTYAWSKVSGPGAVVFGNASVGVTTATFSMAGAYVLRLTVSDGALTATDDVAITVNTSATNQPPVVNAGADQIITLPSSASLSGSATDDGLPTGSTLTYAWSKVSGPGVVTFASASSASTTATFSVAGTYTLRLTASDGALSGSDDMSIIVNSAAVNQAPTVNAGLDQTITLPASVSLAGAATDDGLPTGTLTYQWAKVSGPGMVTFGNATQLNTAADFSAAGTYVLSLTANDGALSSSDYVTVTVNASVSITVDVGVDKTVMLPASAFLDAIVEIQPVGAAVIYTWSKVSGPGAVAFTSASTRATFASFGAPGVYVLRLSVTSGSVTVSDDIVVSAALIRPGGTKRPIAYS